MSVSVVEGEVEQGGFYPSFTFLSFQDLDVARTVQASDIDSEKDGGGRGEQGSLPDGCESVEEEFVGWIGSGVDTRTPPKLE